MSESPQQKKPIEVRFTGGCKDGERLRSDSLNPNVASRAVYYYSVTNCEIGRSFYETSDAAWEDLARAKKTVNEDGTMTMHGVTVPQGPRHKYRLTECLDNEDEVILVFAFAGLRPDP